MLKYIGGLLFRYYLIGTLVLLTGWNVLFVIADANAQSAQSVGSQQPGQSASSADSTANLTPATAAATEVSTEGINGNASSEMLDLDGPTEDNSDAGNATSTRDIWAEAFDLPDRTEFDQALYADVETNINTELFHIDHNISTQLAGAAAASAAWGDYDGDGDVDLLMVGQADSKPSTRIYRNDRGSFTLADTNFVGITRGDLAWGDFDQDGDLDILLSGKNANKQLITIVYENNNGRFTDINAPLSGLLDSRVAWVDFDQDSDLDIFLSGEDDNFYKRTLLYQNNNGQFQLAASQLPSCKCNVAWGDANSDGRLDALVVGTGPYEYHGSVFESTDSGFQNTHANIGAVNQFGSGHWSDFDSDGDLDILISGIGLDKRPVTLLYRNESGQFTEVDTPFHAVTDSSASWGDFDNDGDSDLLLAGYLGEGAPLARLYRNDRTVFTEIHIGLPNLLGGQVAWADYDNDRDLDIFYSGREIDGRPVTQIWTNTGVTNQLPEAPVGLTSQVISDTVFLAWSAGLDFETPTQGLTYSLALQRVENSVDDSPILNSARKQAAEAFALQLTEQATPVHDVASMRHMPSAELLLSPGDYLWAVQTLDPGHGTSAWSAVERLELWPDISVSQTMIPEIAQPGDWVTITLDIANEGLYAASEMTVTAAIPPNISLSSVEHSFGNGVTVSRSNTAQTPMVSWDAKPIEDESASSSTFQWTVRNLAAAEAGQIKFIGQIDVNETEIVTSTVTVDLENDQITENNQSYYPIALHIEPATSWFDPILAFLMHQKIMASLGFGMICLVLATVMFIR